MSSITPTIGRKVWYAPSELDLSLGMTLLGGTSIVDATVIWVSEDGAVTLHIVDHAGSAFVRPGVSFGVLDELQGGQACWMPYQLSQAAKDAASESSSPA